LNEDALVVYKPVSIERIIHLDDVYMFSPRKRFKWLQRAALWILRKLGCHYEHTHFSHSRTPVDLDKLFGMVLECKEAVRAIHRREAGYLVLGQEQLLRLDLEDEYSAFNVPDDDPGFTRGISFAGLRVVCVPWFDGIVVLPKDL
jgi:hypothetical protein